MKLKTLTPWLIVMMLPMVYVQAQETDVRQRAKSYEPLIAAAAQRYGVDPRLLWTIAYLESRFRQGAISYKEGKPRAYGMMQFTAPTAARYGLKDPHSVREAIDAAARYVRDLQERFGARGDLILAAYNAGEGTVEAFRDGRKLKLRTGKLVNPNGIRTGGVPPYLETREYVARGKTVYQSISRQGLFVVPARSPSRASAEPPAAKNTESEVPRELSIYTLPSGKKQTSKPALKTSKSARLAESIYVN
jgi:soluble lytic murein transglycosylase-like protein